MNRSLRPTALALSAITSLVCVQACRTQPAERSSWEGREIRGRVLDQPIPKIDFTLPSTVVDSFTFRDRTDGFLTLLFFGYTHCPDVCPIHMSNIATVLRKMRPSLAARVKVVFVTTDPDRDTLARLRDWLAHFDPDFVGVRAPIEQINALQASMGLGAAYTEDWPDGTYGVAHAAQVIAFVGDGPAQIVYPFGTRQSDWAHDLPMLVGALQ